MIYVLSLASFGNTLQVGLTVLTIASLGGLGLMRGTVVNLRENLRDARDEIADKDRRLLEAEARLTAQEARMSSQDDKIHAQERNIVAISATVTGEAHWESIGHTLNDHHAEAVKHWRKDEQLLQEIRDAQRGTR